MKTIRLNRKNHVLYIGGSSEDINNLVYITMIYNVSHVRHCGDGWYDIFNGYKILGFITDVEKIEERW